MTELQAYLAMLDRAGIAYKISKEPTGSTTVRVDEGYFGFFFELDFDADGLLTECGAYED